MFERLERIARRYGPRSGKVEHEYTSAHLRLAAAELLLATAIDAAVQHLFNDPDPRSESTTATTRALSLASILIAPLTAAAHVAHGRDPRDGTTRALTLLNTATFALGGALIASEALAGRHGPRRLGPFGLTSAALLGFAIDAHERAVCRDRKELRRRADIVERLVPKRRPRLDHVVVHV